MTNDFTNKSDKQLIMLVKRGQEAFFEMAFAVLEIDRRKVWKASAKSMAEFCEAEFGMSPADVTRYKKAARVLMNLEGFSTLPVNEGQARELGKHYPEPQKTVWKAVLDRVAETKETITARLIAEMAGTVLGSQEKKSEPLSGVGRLEQVAKTLSEVQITDDERKAALDQVKAIEVLVKHLKAKLS